MTTTQETINSYTHFDALLQGRNYDSRKLENNTYVTRYADNSIAIRLHSTDVVTYYPDGRVLLNTAGWNTPTTFDRIREYGPGEPYSVNMGMTKRIPYILINGTWYHFPADNQVWLQQSALDGTITLLMELNDPEQEERMKAYHKHLEKLIKAYVDGLTHDRVLEVLEDMGGDCVYCSMQKQDGESLGDAHNVTHLWEHIQPEEMYYMGSLIINAYKHRGYRDVNLILSLNIRDTRTDKYSGIVHVHENVTKYFRDSLYNNAACMAMFANETGEN